MASSLLSLKAVSYTHLSMITLENMSTPDTLKLKSDLEGVEGVQKVMWTSDFIDVTTPKEMLPSDIQKFFDNDSGATMLIVQFDAPSADARTMNAQKPVSYTHLAGRAAGGAFREALRALPLRLRALLRDPGLHCKPLRRRV